MGWAFASELVMFTGVLRMAVAVAVPVDNGTEMEIVERLWKWQTGWEWEWKMDNGHMYIPPPATD